MTALPSLAELQPNNPLYRKAFQAFCRFLLRALTRLQVSGLENIPAGGPLLVTANHLHWLDAPLLFIFLPFPITVMAAEKYERKYHGCLMRPLGVIFVQRGEVDRRALRKALAILEAGGVIGIAPEGTRSKTGGLQEGKRGAAYLAYRTGAALVPVAIAGVEKVFPALRRFRRATVTVTVGQPYRLPEVASKPTSEDLGAATTLIMKRLAELLPEEYRGVYG